MGESASASRRHRLVLLLAVNSGATDAIGVLALGGAFTSVMTGNMVLTGVGAASRDWSLVLLALGAILSFCAGCAVGALIAGTPQDADGPWPRPITVALLAQIGLTLAFAVGWWVVGAEPGAALQLVFLLVNAMALGIQSSAVQRLGQSGLSTTYLTGTLTSLVVRLATGHRLGAVSGSLQVIGALVVGAVVGAALVEHAPLGAPVVQLACLLIVVGAAYAGLRGRGTGQPMADPAM